MGKNNPVTDKFEYLKTPERFFTSYPDPGVFDFEGDNLAKLFLDEIFSRQFARSVPAWSPQRSKRSATGLVVNILRLMRGLALTVAAGIFPAGKKTYIFLGSNGRTINRDGVTYDIFNHKIINTLKKQNCLIMEPIDGGGKKTHQPDLFLHDFILFRLAHQFLARKRIRPFVKRLKEAAVSPLLTESESVQILSKYLANKWIYSIILKAFGIKKALVICHYGKESFTAACKARGIEVIELMHGLIFPSNPNYCYSGLTTEYRNSLRSSQLPDRLGIFGPLWRDMLAGNSYFNVDELFETGYYLESSIFDAMDARQTTHPGNLPGSVEPGKKNLLISTQPIYQEELIAYINFLKDQLDQKEWKVIIKPHPAEKKAVYEGVEEPGFVEISLDSVYSLLPQVQYHISVSSSVIFEAVYFPISNYVLYIPGQKEICDQMIATGAGRRLNLDEIPAEYEVDPFLRGRIFSNYDENALLGGWTRR